MKEGRGRRDEKGRGKGWEGRDKTLYSQTSWTSTFLYVKKSENTFKKVIRIIKNEFSNVVW